MEEQVQADRQYLDDDAAARATGMFISAATDGDISSVDDGLMFAMAEDMARSPKVTAAMFGIDDPAASPTPDSTYSFFLGRMFDLKARKLHEETEGLVKRDADDRLVRRLARLSRACPTGEEGVDAAFNADDRSALRKYAEDLYFS